MKRSFIRAMHFSASSSNHVFDLERAVERISSQESCPIVSDYAPLLRQCSKQRSLHSGRRLHAQILRHRLDRHTLLCNLLVQMYGRCGCLDEARSIFDKTPERNLFSWSIMIAAYAQNGHPTFALAVYREMLQRSIHAIDSTTYVSALSACSALGDLETGKSIHERILSSKLEIDAFLGTALISMYSKCGCLEEAHECFDCVLRKDIVVWNAIIAAFAQNGHPQRALNFFHAIPRGELQPNNLTLVSALDACSDLAALEEGRKIHALIESSPELTLGGSMGNALVNLYGKCGRVIDARAVFDALRPRTVVSWTSMIAAYAQNGHSDQALELFQRMDMAPNGVTLLSVLQACVGRLDRLREIHATAESRGLARDLSVANTLIDVYGKCEDVDGARAVFDSIPIKNVVSWNAMIAAYAHNWRTNPAVELFHRMDLEGAMPNAITFVTVLGACPPSSIWNQNQNIPENQNLDLNIQGNQNMRKIRGFSLALGAQIHERIVASGLQSDVIVATAVLTMYGRCQRLDVAERVFLEMGGAKNAVSWNALINACVENGECDAALRLFFRMMSEPSVQPNGLTFVAALEASSALGDLATGKAIHERIVDLAMDAETVVTNALITMYGRCGSLSDARKVLESSSSRDVVSWNAMIAAYARNGHHKEVLDLYWAMLLEGYRPVEATFLPLLDACCCLRDVESEHRKGSHAGKTIHAHIRLAGFDGSPLLDSALVNMYGKVGNLDSAMVVFTQMRERDAITWTAMISSYAQHGHSRQALSLFSSMLLDGIATDAVTLACVSSACSHSGDVKLGWDYFVSSVRDFGERPTFEHYVVMSDMLSRAGRLQEAEDLLRSMPFQPDLVSWRTLLSACSNHNNPHVGKRAADRILELSPSDPAALVLLSNIYSAAGMSDEAEKLRREHKIGVWNSICQCH
ncbi:pentatricopeptide repeat-containing protein At2g13600 [Selaginella moellendorffii]|uniref:pentatricopeptide repeat-containing protein At2g13600 n=1 Tax=Selaginella moellendorffii TaxID=88036 RepID=UPI000D1C769D|nr:pentatricopeptide repeat-containing protein At2g13600 [Selaginella moellendorffii]|eukprot:XP_024520666.1 pentatricopeptide repeat-containing protein At2g13600 [Selaginella moellendorffii]